MPCIDINCDACGKRQVFQSSMRGSFGVTQIGGMMMAQGWSASVISGRAACSDGCRAELERDVVPEFLAIEV